MRLALAILGAAIVGLSGCEHTIQYREGTTFAQADRDDLDCDVRALQRFPVVLETYERRECEPDYVTCDESGNCQKVEGECEWVTEVEDVNEDARRDDARACMDSKGYAKVSLPVCPESVRELVTPEITRVMPRLTEDACVILWDNGKQIVNLQRVPAQ